MRLDNREEWELGLFYFHLPSYFFLASYWLEELGALGDFHFPRFFGRIEGFVASFFSSSPTEKEDSFFDEFFISDQKGILVKATLSVLRKSSSERSKSSVHGLSP